MENNKENTNIKKDDNFYDINKIPSQSEMHNESDSERNVQDETGRAYAHCLNVFANISDCDNKVERDKLFKIILILIKNIIDKPKEDKFKKLKLSNKNIQSLFEIHGMYDLFQFMGFREEFVVEENDLYLFLGDYDQVLFELVHSFLNLLISDCNEELKLVDKNPELSAAYEYPTLAELNLNEQDKNQIKSMSNIVDVLRQTKENRIISNNNSSSKTGQTQNIHNRYHQNKNKDIKSILKETADLRKTTSQQYSNYNQTYKYTNESVYDNPMTYNYNNQVGNAINQNKGSNQDKKFATLSDLKFQNPELNHIYKRDYKVNDEIGKKCLAFTNEFRKRNGLGPVDWSDDIWKICLEHSHNMGLKKVRFGHDGFNERIEKLPFSYSLACENVFMCNGYSEYRVAELSVNGWINSPGHRKNLLSYSSHCAIAVYRNGYGEYFLTQIFVRK